ncbi:MAG TPA: hypothetical protein VF313_01625 [Anaerolineaceae bacterium]
MNIEKIEYNGWPNCYRLFNDLVELVITSDVGPRIIRYAFIGEPNEFMENPEDAGKTGGVDWRLYGGHRLWHAPEDKVRTYFPDNYAVQVRQYSKFLRVTQLTEPTTGIQKEIDIRLDPETSHVKVTHRLVNNNLWQIELSAWALSVMDVGGVAILPLPPRGEHPKDILASSTLTLWPYTDLSDPRWTLGKKYVLFRQNPRWPNPQKIGALVPDGWVAYARAGHLFVKKFTCYLDGAYPDYGCAVELFNRADMAEMETLGPVVLLAPGEGVEHIEDWYLLNNVPQPNSEADVEQFVTPHLSELK